MRKVKIAALFLFGMTALILLTIQMKLFQEASYWAEYAKKPEPNKVGDFFAQIKQRFPKGADMATVKEKLNSLGAKEFPCRSNKDGQISQLCFRHPDQFPMSWKITITYKEDKVISADAFFDTGDGFFT